MESIWDYSIHLLVSYFNKAETVHASFGLLHMGVGRRRAGSATQEITSDLEYTWMRSVDAVTAWPAGLSGGCQIRVSLSLV